jgi:zinc transport system permease protein
MEALTAFVFASGVAIAFLFLPIDQAERALVGDVSQAGVPDTLITALICVLLILVIRRIYPKLVLINISEDLAASEGIKVRRYNLLYLLLIAVIVALGVKMVGGLLTAALVAIPPSTARNLSGNLTQYSLGSMVIGMFSALTGIFLFHYTGYPAGPLIVVVSAAAFLLSLAFAHRR